MSAPNENIGYSGTGTFTQSGGTNAIANDLVLCYNTGSSGAYSLSSSGLLFAPFEFVGGVGPGSFTQSGGTNTIYDFLVLGDPGGSYPPGGSGTYSLSGGSLYATSEYVGDFGAGSFTQSGGTNTIPTSSGGTLSIGCASAGSGTYSLSSGSLSAPNEFVGQSGTGTFTQSGGTNSVPQGQFGFSVGFNSGASGTYSLSGGSLSAPVEYVAYSGSGSFTQSGGTNAVFSVLAVGFLGGSLGPAGPAGSGSYSLSGGSLYATSEYVGDFGAGSFTQSGGTNTIPASSGGALFDRLRLGRQRDLQPQRRLVVRANEFVGQSGTGTFTQSGGTNFVTSGGSSSSLYLGYSPGASGTYSLSAGPCPRRVSSLATPARGTSRNPAESIPSPQASLASSSASTPAPAERTASAAARCTRTNEYVGYSGTGNFTQSGGTNDLTGVGSLSIAYSSGSGGTYNLSGGSVSAFFEYVACSGTGNFTQSGGTNAVSNVFALGQLGGSLGPAGSGTLQPQRLRHLVGTDRVRGRLRRGNLHAVRRNEHNPQWWHSLHRQRQEQQRGLQPQRRLVVARMNEIVGQSGTGTFTQSGGTNSLSTGQSGLVLGFNPGSSGTYNLSGGSLYGASEMMGDSGTGNFTQSGGTNTAGGLTLAYNPASRGTYNLNGGTLIVSAMGGGPGTAAFNFGGGTLQAGDPFSTSLPMTLTGSGGNATVDTAGYTVTLSGPLSGPGGLTMADGGTLILDGPITYSGGTTILAGQLEINAPALATGNFTQTGGLTTISGTNLYLGFSSGSSGTYSLSGSGSLQAPNEYVGYSGTGTFTQSGGLNELASSVGTLSIGYASGSSGTYSLTSSGQLQAPNEYVGYSGTGKFTQSGGTNAVSGNGSLSIAYTSGSSGTYSLGGRLVVRTG